MFVFGFVAVAVASVYPPVRDLIYAPGETLSPPQHAMRKRLAMRKNNQGVMLHPCYLCMKGCSIIPAQNCLAHGMRAASSKHGAYATQKRLPVLNTALGQQECGAQDMPASGGV